MVKALFVLIIIVFYSSFHIYSQTICLGQDTTICEASSVNIDLCVDPTLPSPDTNVVFLGDITKVTLTDDVFSGVVNIGFDFDFYGDTHNQCVIGSNNYISFELSQANGACAWPITSASPSVNNPIDAIMAPWQDINPGLGGTIGYKTIGLAPFRKFVVVFKDIPTFQDDQPTCSAIVLNETTNIIEIHIDEKPAIPGGWNDGAAIHGTENNNSNIADIYPGRNFPAVWSTSLEGSRWTPNGANAYDETIIPYKSYVPANADIVWGDTQGNTYDSNEDGSITFTHNTAQTYDSVGVFINYSSCDATGGGNVSEISWIRISRPEVTTTVTDDICSQNIGEITATPVGAGPFTFLWSDENAQTTQTASNLSSGGYLLTATDVYGCSDVAIGVVGDNPINTTTNYTQVSCPGGANGTATVVITPTPGSANYNWYDVNAETTQDVANLSAGTYHVEVVTDLGCIDTAEVVVDEVDPLQIALETLTNVSCNSTNDGFVEISVSGGTAPYSFSWNNSTSVGNNAPDLFAGDYTVTVEDFNACTLAETYTVTEPTALSITSFTTDFVICPEDSTTLKVVATGGSSAYLYKWYQDGVVISTADSVVVDPSNALTNYCIEVDEVCGSPTADSCVISTFPDEIYPNLTPSITESCVPVEVDFQNSTNSSEIDYTIWHFDDGTKDTIYGLIGVSHAFESAELYDITLETYSIFGCKYDTVFTDFIEGWPYPESDFSTSPSQFDIFNSDVRVWNRSSADAEDFVWEALGGTPEASTLEDPEFSYPDSVAQYTITLITTNQYGCKDTLSKIIDIKNTVQVFSPNSFTPNGDEFNNTWKISIDGIDLQSFNLEIYNRWGQTIFQSLNKDFQWDGTYNGLLVPTGSYPWRIIVKDSHSGKKLIYNGVVNVIR